MEAQTAARSGLRLAHELGRFGMDVVVRSGGLPRRAAELDARVLSRVLGRSVTAVTALDGTSGTTERARLGLTGPGLPGTVFVKTAAADAGTRLFGGLARLGEVEVGFYRDLRPGLDLEAPELVGASFDGRTGRFVIVLEDLAARGARFVDTLAPLTVDQVAAALSTLARLHGRTNGRVDLPAWLGTNSGDALLPLVAATLGRLVDRVSAAHPGLVTSEGERLVRSYRRWAARLDEGPHSVLHGDPHPGNIYLLGDPGGDRVGLLDWQAVRRGNPQRDATYHLVLSLPPAVRREHERDLLDHYRRELAAAGGPDRSAAETWLDHRRMVAYAYVATVFTSGLGGLQGAEIADAGLRRAAAALADLDTAEVVGAPA